MNHEPVWQAAPAPALDWEDANQPWSREFEDYYYSSEHGLAESEYVFLHGNNLPSAWQSSDRFTIAETGFGTGLNFLASWQRWRKDPGNCRQLHYIGYEKFPLRETELRRSLQRWPDLKPLSEQLLANYPPPLPGTHRLIFDAGAVILDLIIADVLDATSEQLEDQNLKVDCWYLDGFTPARNPEMWQPELYQRMAHLSRAGASFATYTAAGAVRRGLIDAGFSVNKASGYGVKREMCHGRLEQNPAAPPPPTLTPWHRPSHSDSPSHPNQRHAIVLGAGLAGATVAAALARRGWRITVLDQGAIGDGASGNRQGVLYTRLSHRDSDLNSFSVHSYNFALRLYQHMIRNQLLRPGQDGELCGALHALTDWNQNHELFSTVQSLPELVSYLDPAASAAATGLTPAPPGLWYPGAGWMQPAAICRALLSLPGIEVHEHCGPLQLEANNQGWGLLAADGRLVASAATAVLANGINSGQTPATDWLPLQRIRGQTTELTSSDDLRQLRSVICHAGYIAPASAGTHCIGATFAIGDDEPATRLTDHRHNIDKLRDALPGVNIGQQDATESHGRVGFRCASPDYLPMAGPVPDREPFLETYAPLRRNARRVIAEEGPYLPGLYLSTAHGSRGLTSTPLAAEILAAQICAEPLPVPTALARALNPGRFLIRDLSKNRI